MSMEVIDKAQTKHENGKRHQSLSLFIALFLALTMFATKTYAQIIGEMEANIPFQFYAGNAKLPPGKYVIHVLDDSDLTIMEISSADGRTSALFSVRRAEAKSNPAKGELIFNKYENRYFLAELFDEGNPSGSRVEESRYEKRISKAAAETQEHVPVHHRARQGTSGS
jgi:hypothetical protein